MHVLQKKVLYLQRDLKVKPFKPNIMKKVTEKINKKIEKLLTKYNAAEGKEFEKMYRVYGDIESANYTDDHTLEIFFVSKAYGNEGTYHGTIGLMDDATYKKSAPKESYNPFRDEWYWSCPTNEFAANSLARFIGECGSKVKRINYTEYKD